MESRVYRAAVLALYQVALVAGICMLPLAIAVRKAGLSLPIHRVLLRLERAYDRATPE